MSAIAIGRKAGMPGVDEFEALDFDPAEFNHEAHVYVGWQLACRCGATAAAIRFTDTLKRLLEKVGAPDKYNETVSWFFMLLIAERQSLQRHDSWQAFRHDNPDLLGNVQALLSCYYSAERIGSPLARRQFLLPDRFAAGKSS